MNGQRAKPRASVTPAVLRGMADSLDHHGLGSGLTFAQVATQLRAAAAEVERLERLREALGEIVRREAVSDYTSIYAAPGEFAWIARAALAGQESTE
jgi:hypothetical protein